MPHTEEDHDAGWLGVFRSHPGLVAIMLVCALGGIPLAIYFLPDWSTSRQIAGGLIGGFGVGLIVVFQRLTGAWSE